MPVDEKRRRSDLLIRNARTLEHVRNVVRLTWNDRLARSEEPTDANE
jgi:hypothetical protein